MCEAGGLWTAGFVQDKGSLRRGRRDNPEKRYTGLHFEGGKFTASWGGGRELGVKTALRYSAMGPLLQPRVKSAMVS